MEKESPLGVTVLIVFVVSIAAILIFWNMMKPLMENSSGEMNNGNMLSINLGIDKTSSFINGNNASIFVERRVGAGDLEGILFIFSNGQEKYNEKREVTMGELEMIRFDFDLTGKINGAKSVEIYPVIKVRNEEKFGTMQDKMGN